jgi:hypothetical protein
VAQKVARRQKRKATPVPPHKDGDALDTQRHRLLRTSNRPTRLRNQTQGNKTILERAFWLLPCMPLSIKGGWIVSTPSTRPGNTPSQRRSQRIFLCVGIIVHGQKADGTAFSERTKTEVVSAHGALILLREPVSAGQSLTLGNILTSEEVPCTVAESNPGQAGVAEVGVQFVHPSPRFWRVAFPPSDWSSRSPEAKDSIPKTQIHPKPANKK